MAGLLTFHAHPDDEVISTGGILARYAAEGRPTMVVTATDGSEGEIHNYDDPDAIRPRLAEVRSEEVAAALSILGVAEHAFLGYRDSGMMGEPSNLHPDCFWQADFEEAVGRLVHVIRRFRPEVMVIYDPFGGYGHPDHVQVHRVGLAAHYALSDLAQYPLADGEEPGDVPKLYWSAWTRSRRRRFAELRLESGHIDQAEFDQAVEGGVPDEIVTFVDVTDLVDVKLKALRAHRSQIPDDWFMLAVPADLQGEILGRESFVRIFSPPDHSTPEDDLFAGL